MLTVAVSEHFYVLLLVRCCMGMGEAVIFPTLHQFCALWYTSSERTHVVSLIASGSDLGTIVALILSPWILSNYGWQYIFITFSAFSAIWAVYFMQGYSNEPIQQEGQQLLLSEIVAPPSVLTYAKNRSIWGIIAAHICFNYGWYILLCWFPQYMVQVLHFDLHQHPILAATPYICGFIGLLSFGRLSDYLLRHEIMSLVCTRKLMNAIGLIGPAIFLFALRFTTNATVSLILLSLSLFTGRASTSGFWVHMIDVHPQFASTTMGISNTFATIPGIAGNILTGYILQYTSSWNLVFLVTSLVLSFGAIAFQILVTPPTRLQNVGNDG